MTQTIIYLTQNFENYNAKVCEGKYFLWLCSVADPGFLRGGADPLFDQFLQNLHENEKLLACGGLSWPIGKFKQHFNILEYTNQHSFSSSPSTICK